MADPAFSVVIASRDRREQLRALLAALARQRPVPGGFEVVVVDDGSSDGTGRMLEELEGGGFPLRALRLGGSGPGAASGPAAARNAGAREARGSVLAFTDSDCEPLPGWLEALGEAFKDRELVLAGGPELAHPADPLFARCVWAAMNSIWTSGGVRGRAGWSAAPYRPRGFNMAVRREDFLRAGGFEESWRYAEDIELSGRLARAGGRAAFVPDAAVRHRKRAGPGEFWTQISSFGRARVRLALREGRPPSGAYCVPALLVLAEALSLPGWVPPAAWAPAAVLAAVVGVEAALRLRDPRALALGALAAWIQIHAYGVGFLRGILGR